MGGAFITRNPLLPLNFFVPQGVDPFLVKMNQGVEHSLLDCPGRFTVQVATFRGKTILQTGKDEPKDKGGVGWRWGKSQDDPLIEAAESAHLLTELLREHGFEAYEFHDRTESYVTIGSFDQVGSRLPNGQLAPATDVQQIVQKFGAAYDSPADPLTGDDIRRARQADDLKAPVLADPQQPRHAGRGRHESQACQDYAGQEGRSDHSVRRLPACDRSAQEEHLERVRRATIGGTPLPAVRTFAVRRGCSILHPLCRIPRQFVIW